MKLLFLLFLPFIAAMSAATPAETNAFDLSELRRRYQQAANDAAASASLHQLLKTVDKRQGAVVLGYRAASEALQAKHTGGMFDKLDRLKTADKLFTEAVMLDSRSLEVRFLRYSIESNVPAFLGMSKHRDEDRAMLQQALKQPNGIPDEVLHGAIHGFLKDKKELPAGVK